MYLELAAILHNNQIAAHAAELHDKNNFIDGMSKWKNKIYWIPKNWLYSRAALPFIQFLEIL